MTPDKTVSLSAAERRLSVTRSWIEGTFSVVENLIRWGFLAYIAHQGYLSVAVLAGKSTFADVGLKFLADVRVSESVAYLLGLSGVGYGLSQRRLRRKTTERLQERAVAHEKEVDPNRTSSRLTKTGETNPEDKR